MSHSHESINTSRRRFMQAASLSGAAVAVGALTACGKTGASDPKQPASAVPHIRAIKNRFSHTEAVFIFMTLTKPG